MNVFDINISMKTLKWQVKALHVKKKKYLTRGISDRFSLDFGDNRMDGFVQYL